MFVSERGKANPNHCGCPEVKADPDAYLGLDVSPDGFLPYCAARIKPEVDLAAAKEVGPDPSPTEWRCPRCTGPIVRIFLERTEAGQPSAFIDDPDNLGEMVVRAGYACRSARCGWRGWILFVGKDVEAFPDGE